MSSIVPGQAAGRTKTFRGAGPGYRSRPGVAAAPVLLATGLAIVPITTIVLTKALNPENSPGGVAPMKQRHSSMRRIALAALISATALIPVRTATAGPVYVALGDSITFGETDLRYVPSNGDRGYVGLVADDLAGRNGGVRPTVVNLAIDGETASSFKTGAGRVPPVVGRTDAVLAAENLNYNPNALVSQETKFLSTVAAERTAGNTINTVSITLGFNDLSTAIGKSSTQVDQILATYRTEYGSILGEIRQALPNADLRILGYFNPFPANPTSPAAPVFNARGTQLNGIIRDLAAQYGGSFVDTAPPFVGHEAEYTFLAQQPAGSSSPAVGPFVGTEPIGNVHPNATGYRAIAAQVEAVPEPGSVALLATGCLTVIVAARARRRNPGGSFQSND